MTRTWVRLFLALLLLCGLAVGAGFLLLLSRRGGDSAAGQALFTGGFIAFFIVSRIRATVRDAFLDGLRLQLLQVLTSAGRGGESWGGALEALSRDFDGDRRKRILAVLAELDGGAPLGVALGKAGKDMFSTEELAAILVAEGAGRSVVLIAELPREREGKGVDWRRLGLPFLYAVASLIVGGFLSMAIFPQFHYIFSQVEAEGAAGATVRRGLDSLDHAVAAVPAGIALALLLVLPILLFELSRRFPRIHRALGDRMAMIPGIAGSARLAAGERVCRILAVLLPAGMSLHEALHRAAPVAGSEILAHSVEESAIAVAHGEPVARAMAVSGLPRFLGERLAAVSGGTPESMGRALKSLSRECGERLRGRRESLTATVYPATLVVVAIFVYFTFRGVTLVLDGLREGIRPW